MIEFFSPEALITREPVVGLPHRCGTEPASNGAPLFVAHHQSGIRQHIEMFHDRRQGHCKWFRKLADRPTLCLTQLSEQGTPRWIGERRKRPVERGLLIVNHMVKYMGSGEPVKCGGPTFIFR